MVRSIGRAKAEIAAIKHPMSAEDQMEQASLQLDTIVQTIEGDGRHHVGVGPDRSDCQKDPLADA